MLKLERRARGHLMTIIEIRFHLGMHPDCHPGCARLPRVPAGRSTTEMIFSVRQQQEKRQKQNQSFLLASIDLTKAFYLVSRSRLFQLLKKIGCPPKLHSIIESFHTDMRSTVSYNGATSDPFPISSGVKQGCVLAPLASSPCSCRSPSMITRSESTCTHDLTPSQDQGQARHHQ